jgi:hypothetical protein
MAGMRVERLDHLGIVAGVCQEIGLAEYLDALAWPSQQQVSVGTATVAMNLNGLGFSNRQLKLVSQFFATKPVEYLLEGWFHGEGATRRQSGAGLGLALRARCDGAVRRHCPPGASALAEWGRAYTIAHDPLFRLPRLTGSLLRIPRPRLRFPRR